jgi:acetyltransferase-like isoleucine patch superfamily enzyme/acyl carrier protein
MSLRRAIRFSNHRFARLLRRVYYFPAKVSLPCPKLVVLPVVLLFLALRQIGHFLRRVFIAEPFFKAHCQRYGKGLHTGIFVHWIQGKPHIVLGDYVTIDGRCSFKFAARYTEHPELIIGSHTGISHGCRFTIGKRIVIGGHCRLASGVEMFDAPGHPNDPEARMKGEPAPDDAVRPVIIGDNVWIGRNSTIFPGVRIGDNAVIASASAVFTDVPANTVVAGNPARPINLIQSSDPASTSSRQTTAPAGGPALGTLVREIVGVIIEVGRLRDLSPGQDFYNEGVSSVASLTLLLQLEEKFQVSIPDDQFIQCRTANQLGGLLFELGAGAAQSCASAP